MAISGFSKYPGLVVEKTRVSGVENTVAKKRVSGSGKSWLETLTPVVFIL